MLRKTSVRDRTRNRILKKSLLFNKRGVHDVSAHDLARDLKISSGNLTYHFKKKNDIVNSLSDQLEKQMLKALEFAALHTYSFLEPYYADQVRGGIYQYIVHRGDKSGLT